MRRALEELAELEDLEIAQHVSAAVVQLAPKREIGQQPGAAVFQHGPNRESTIDQVTLATTVVEPASIAVSLGEGGQKSLSSMSLAVLSVPFLCPAARSPRQAPDQSGFDAERS